jgi:hypothetical protein
MRPSFYNLEDELHNIPYKYLRCSLEAVLNEPFSEIFLRIFFYKNKFYFDPEYYDILWISIRLIITFKLFKK